MNNSDIWPLSHLTLETDRLRLRYPRPGDFPRMVELIKGVRESPGYGWFWQHAPGFDGDADMGVLQQLYRGRADWSPESWWIPFAVEWKETGDMCAIQEMGAVGFPALRTFETDSLVDERFRRRGIATEMRVAVLHFGFEVLGARRATSTALTTNVGSLAVSRSLGYEDNGVDRKLRAGVPMDEQRLVLSVDRFRSFRPDEVHVAVTGDASLGRFFFPDLAVETVPKAFRETDTGPTDEPAVRRSRRRQQVRVADANANDETWPIEVVPRSSVRDVIAAEGHSFERLLALADGSSKEFPWKGLSAEGRRSFRRFRERLSEVQPYSSPAEVTSRTARAVAGLAILDIANRSDVGSAVANDRVEGVARDLRVVMEKVVATEATSVAAGSRSGPDVATIAG